MKDLAQAMNISTSLRKVLVLGVTTVQILTLVPSAEARTFSDVAPSDWFYPYTEQLASAGIVATTNPGYFPFKSLTRAELAKMAVKTIEYQRLLTIPAAGQSNFCDIASNDWALPFVDTLNKRGVVQGTPANCAQGKRFLPNNQVTRAEALKILLGIYGIAPQGTTNFADVVRGSWYEPYIASATRIGLVSGYPNGTFGPNAFLTRAEMSKIIVKLSEYASANPTAVRVPGASEDADVDEDEEEDEDEDETPTPTTSPTPTPTTSPTPTPTPTPSPTPSPSSTPTPTPSPSGSLPAGALTFYTLGDSLTEGENDETNMGGYPPRLQTKIANVRPGSRVINVGESGRDSTDVANRQLNTPISASADAALVLIGSNDMWQDCWNEGQDTSAGTISTYQENMERIMSRLSQANIKIFVGLVDDQSRRPDAVNVCTSSAGRTRMTQIANAFNNIIRTKATTYGATVVDFYNTTIFTNSTTLSDDGNHPSAAGYAAMAQLWFNAINPQL